MGESPLPPQIMAAIQELIDSFKMKQGRIRLPLSVDLTEALEILGLLKKMRA